MNREALHSGAPGARRADPRAALPSLLLDLLSPARPVAQACIHALGTEDWKRLLDMARQHRLGPLLHWQLGRAHASLRPPADVTTVLAAAHRDATLRSLQLQRELLLTHRVLAGAGIPHMALKGAALTWHVYPHPALRPMRDLDILVPAGQALRAYEALLDGGLTRKATSPGQPAAMLEIHQHLPPLRSPSGTVTVELHGRLFAPGAGAAGSRVSDLSETEGFWQRGTPMSLADATVRTTSPTDLLLHLIVHAAYDHEFTNGPLILSDIAFLLHRHTIDWPLFWSLAAQCRRVRGCVLALAVTQRYWGTLPIDWQGHAPDEQADLDARIRLAADLMLRDFNARFDVNLQTALAAEPGPAAKARHLLAKLFPPRVQMAATYPVSAHDPRVYLWYPVRWYRLAMERVPMFVRGLGRREQGVEARRLAELRRWLSVGDGDG